MVMRNLTWSHQGSVKYGRTVTNNGPRSCIDEIKTATFMTATKDIALVRNVFRLTKQWTVLCCVVPTEVAWIIEQFIFLKNTKSQSVLFCVLVLHPHTCCNHCRKKNWLKFYPELRSANKFNWIYTILIFGEEIEYWFGSTFSQLCACQHFSDNFDANFVNLKIQNNYRENT